MYLYNFIFTLLIFILTFNSSYGVDNLSSTIIKEVYINYGINTTKYSRILSGIENKVYCLTDRSNKQYILRIYKDNNIKKIEEEVSLLRYLEQNSIIKAVRAVNSKNKQYVNKINDSLFNIFEFIPGHHKVDLDEESLPDIIEIMKKLHVACRKNINFNFHQIENAKDIERFFFKLYKEKVISSKEYFNILNIIQEFFNAISRYKFYTIIHRDLHGQNIIFHDKDIYIIDFDDFIVGTPLIELASFMTRNKFLNSENNTFNLEKAKKIISYYNFAKTTGEHFLSKDLDCMITYDLLILMKIQIQNNCKNINEKRKIVQQIYNNILLIQKHRKYIINSLNL